MNAQYRQPSVGGSPIIVISTADGEHITETGARWFTQPAYCIDDPFGQGV